MIDEFLLERSQRGLRARVETLHAVTGFVLDQAAHRQGDQVFSGSRFGGVERACTFDGKDRLLDLMREEPAIFREVSLRQEVLPVSPDSLRVGAHDSFSSKRSSAAPSGPEARSLESRQSARQIARGSAPC